VPAYQFYALPQGDAEPVTMMFFADPAAIRHALGATFIHGCDLWQAERFVGRFHGAPHASPLQVAAREST